MTPDSLLLCCGFSFFDAHITSVISEALASNTHTAVIAFQFDKVDNNNPAYEVALVRPNLSVYAPDQAVIHGIPGKWQPGQPPSEEWAMIRQTFWETKKADASGTFVLGDFARFARFLGLSQAPEFVAVQAETVDGFGDEGAQVELEADGQGDAGAQQ